MTAYYNEFDPNAAAWLRELIRAGLIAPGDVDERSIKDVKADDLERYTQCHFFAGIGGWSYALRLAGWSDATPVWTGSCPCQPYSSAGKQKGNADERNLWPEFYRLIAECKPSVVFGEQVEGAIRHGWLDGISADLEREGYAVGHCVLGAHSVGAPHIRQRLYWVADSQGERRGMVNATNEWAPDREVNALADDRACDGDLADSSSGRRAGRTRTGRSDGAQVTDDCGMGNSDGESGQQHARKFLATQTRVDSPWFVDGSLLERSPDASDGVHFVACRDGKSRRVAPGVPLLAHGIPGRVAQLRGLGNAIVPPLAAAFIEAYLEAASP